MVLPLPEELIRIVREEEKEGKVRLWDRGGVNRNESLISSLSRMSSSGRFSASGRFWAVRS